MKDDKDYIFNSQDGEASLWDDAGSSSWGEDELEDIHRLLDDGGDLDDSPAQPFEEDLVQEDYPPAEDYPAQEDYPDYGGEDYYAPEEPKEAPRRQRGGGHQQPSKKAAKAKKAAKSPKVKKGKKKKQQPEEDPAFMELPAMTSGGSLDPEKSAQALETEQQEGKKKKGRKKEKAPKPPKGPEEIKQFRLTAIVFAVILSLIFIGVTVGGYMVTTSPMSYPNVYVGQIPVGNMTQEQISQALDEAGWDETVDTTLTVTLPAQVKVELSSSQSGAKLSQERAVQAAMNYGKTGNIYKNLVQYVLNYLAPADVTVLSAELDKSYIQTKLQEGEDALALATQDADYQVDEEGSKLRLMKGAGQIQLDMDALYETVATALEADLREINFVQITGTIDMPDFDKIHEELAQDPADAQFTETFEIIPETVGCWFDVEEAKRLWREADPGDWVEIPLDMTYPETTEESLNAMLYRDLLGSQTTYYTYSTDNRISNIALAASKINGIVLLPGESFSYNDTVGQRTAEAGFLEAGAYDNGEVVQEIGGGICQVSSTLYCATLYAQLETVERTNHYFKVDYLDYGMDATVSWPKPDYKFSNCRDYPVKIVAYCDLEEKSLTVEIWGTDVDGTYVEMRVSRLVVYDQTYVNTAVGYGVSAYRMVYDAEGNYLYEIEEPYGIYYRHDDEIDWPPEKYAADAAAGA